MASRNEESTTMIVAVDFGTTFSSMAVALSTHLATLDLITRWEGQGKTSVNVPTVLQYRGGVSSGRAPIKWGFQAAEDFADDDCERYELFKLRLYKGLQEINLSEITLGVSQMTLAPRIDKRDCKKLVTDYLKAMKASFDRHVQGLYPPSFIEDSLKIEYIVTVPAIWTPNDKNITRNCAIEAGFGSHDTIQIIKEPEAAGLYALKIMIDSNLHLNDTFVICDAGGGTVDLMSYTVAALPPNPKLDEAAAGTGGLCGSIFLNKAFESWLDRRFRNATFFTTEIKSEMMEKFDEDIKKRFDGTAAEPYTLVIRALRGNNSLRYLGFDNGKFTIPTSDLTAIFRQVTDKIVRLVRAQIARTGAPVTTVLLAGGFGQSGYLRGELMRAIPTVLVNHITHSDTAVVRGALLQGLKRTNPDLPYAVIESKVPEMSYGIERWVPYDANRHDSAKNRDSYTQADQVQEMIWFMGKGVRQYESQPIEVALEARETDDGHPLSPMTLDIYQCELDLPPIHKSRGVKNLMTVTAKLNLIPRRRLEFTIGRDGCNWRSVRFKLEVTIGEAGLLKFAVKHNEQSYGEGSVAVVFRR